MFRRLTSALHRSGSAEGGTGAAATAADAEADADGAARPVGCFLLQPASRLTAAIEPQAAMPAPRLQPLDQPDVKTRIISRGRLPPFGKAGEHPVLAPRISSAPNGPHPPSGQSAPA